MKGQFWKKALAGCLALLIVSGGVPVQPFSQVFDDVAITASAHDLGTSGSCGDNATYTVSDSTLTISGTGAINANAFNFNNLGNDYDLSGITNVVIEEGITSIGKNAFYKSLSMQSDITNVSIPASVTTIEKGAFEGQEKLTNVTIAEGSELTTIGESAFENCSFETIVLPCPKLNYIDKAAFQQVSTRKLKTIICLTETDLSLHQYATYYPKPTVYMYHSKKVNWNWTEAVYGLLSVTAGTGIDSVSGTKIYGDYYAEGSSVTVTTSIDDPEFFVGDTPCQFSGSNGTYTVQLPSDTSSDQIIIDAAPKYVDISYIDENGEEQTAHARVLSSRTGGKEDLLDYSGWCVVNKDITIAPQKDGKVYGFQLNGKTNIILADGCTINIGTESKPVNSTTTSSYKAGIGGLTEINIFGQSGNTGKMNIFTNGANGMELNVLRQYGGNVNIKTDGTDSVGIKANDLVQINGGSLNIITEECNGMQIADNVGGIAYKQLGGEVSITPQNSEVYGILTDNGGIRKTGGSLTVNAMQSLTSAIVVNDGDIELLGGSVSATATENGIYLRNKSTTQERYITLGYSDKGDSILASKYDKENYVVFRIADGQYMTNETNVYSGELTYAQWNALAGKTLTPIDTYSVTVGAVTGGKITADKTSAAEGDTVTLTVEPAEGYAVKSVTAGSESVTKVDDTTYTFTMPCEDVTVSATFDPDSAHFSQNGDTYTIHTAAGWGIFCDCLQDSSYNGFSGKTVVLDKDITVTEMAGSRTNPFKGTFDGQKHTLTATISGSTMGVAVFSGINGATIKDLTLSGSITGGQHCGALVGLADGTNLIENVNVTADVSLDSSISAGNAHHGGVIGHALSSNTTLRGVIYSGTVDSKENYAYYVDVGGLVGWADDATITIENSLFAGTYSGGTLFHPILCKTGDKTVTGTFTNVYYTTAPTATDANYYVANAGKAAHTITAGENVTVALSGTATEYDVSGITAYSTGLAYDGNFYAGNGDTVALTLGNTAPDGFTFKGYTVNAGKLDGDTLTMSDEDVTISAEFGYTDGIGAHLAGYSLSLDGDIGVNFYMELDKSVLDAQNAYMQFTFDNGKEPQTVPLDKTNYWYDSNTHTNYYIFKCRVTSKEMTDTITAQMFADGKSGIKYPYSVKKYADTFLKAPATYTEQGKDPEKAEALVRAMLNYGAYSQTYFKYKTDSLPAEKEAVSSVTADTLTAYSTYDDKHLPKDETEKIIVDLAGATLELESETVINLYFTNDTGKTLSFTTDSNVELAQRKSGNYTIVKITGIPAQDNGKLIKVHIYIDGVDSGYVEYCPFHYCYNVLSRETTQTRTEELKDCIRAFVIYTNAAANYAYPDGGDQT